MMASCGVFFAAELVGVDAACDATRRAQEVPRSHEAHDQHHHGDDQASEPPQRSRRRLSAGEKPVPPPAEHLPARARRADGLAVPKVEAKLLHRAPRALLEAIVRQRLGPHRRLGRLRLLLRVRRVHHAPRRRLRRTRTYLRFFLPAKVYGRTTLPPRAAPPSTRLRPPAPSEPAPTPARATPPAPSSPARSPPPPPRSAPRPSSCFLSAAESIFDSSQETLSLTHAGSVGRAPRGGGRVPAASERFYVSCSRDIAQERCARTFSFAKLLDSHPHSARHSAM